MKAWTQNNPCLVVIVIVRCGVKVKGGLHATIFRRDYILESKKKCYVGPDRHLTDKSHITCKLISLPWEASCIENDFNNIK